MDGAYALTVTNSGGSNAGDVTFTGAVGGGTALTGLTITTDVLTAAAIRSSGTLSATTKSLVDPKAGTPASSITGIISDGGSALAVTKAGIGELTLSGANTYTGLTTISAGRLRAANDTALGTTASGTTVASGAQLELYHATGITIGAEALTLNGT